MNNETIVRAWRDPAFRASLSEAQRAELPESPCGKPMTELDETELSEAVGGQLNGVEAAMRPRETRYPICQYA
jgi:mersacidin/lichenicidin family type 2 lantibiotic